MVSRKSTLAALVCTAAVAGPSAGTAFAGEILGSQQAQSLRQAVLREHGLDVLLPFAALDFDAICGRRT